LLGIDALGLIRLIHLLAGYWFVFELVVHVGVLELDPNVWKYHKAIFWSGKEDLSDSRYAEIVKPKPKQLADSEIWHESSEKSPEVVKD